MAPAPREPFGPSAWFTLSVGRASRAEPRWILPMLCRVGGFDREEIGAIRIQENETFVEIKDGAVPDSLQGPEGAITLEDGAVLSRLAEAPDLSQRDGAGPARKPREGRGPASSARPSNAGRKPRAAREDRGTPHAPREDRAPRPPRAQAAPAPATAAVPPAPSEHGEAGPAPRKPRHKDKKPGDKPLRDKTFGDRKPEKPADGRAPSERFKERPPREGRGDDTPYKPRGAGPKGDFAGKPRRDASDSRKPQRDAGPAEAPRRFNAANDPSQKLGPDGKPLRPRGGGKFAGKPGGKPGGKPSGKPGGRKTFAAKGPDATPRWKKPKR
jgi:ATP-dependent RNA helicase DeaD